MLAGRKRALPPAAAPVDARRNHTGHAARATHAAPPLAPAADAGGKRAPRRMVSEEVQTAPPRGMHRDIPATRDAGSQTMKAAVAAAVAAAAAAVDLVAADAPAFEGDSVAAAGTPSAALAAAAAESRRGPISRLRHLGPSQPSPQRTPPGSPRSPDSPQSGRGRRPVAVTEASIISPRSSLPARRSSVPGSPAQIDQATQGSPSPSLRARSRSLSPGARDAVGVRATVLVELVPLPREDAGAKVFGLPSASAPLIMLREAAGRPSSPTRKDRVAAATADAPAAADDAGEEDE